MEQVKHIERRLAAILSADVVGYSRMMAADEAATVTEVKRCREIIDTDVREHHGRIVDAPGDNVLAEFPSAVEAVQCAVEVQRELADRSRDLDPARKMAFRIGIHVGDVILDDGKIYGDGVNIAARLEALATPGGICISREVHDQIRGKLDIDCDDIGEQQVKNIPRPVRVLRVRMGPAPLAPATRPPSRRRAIVGSIAMLGLLAASAALYFVVLRKPHRGPAPIATSAASKTTVAVLPFTNLSANKEDEYFSDGMTDEIRGDLSKIAGLRVAARTSSFSFKGQNQDAKKIAGLLGVKNLLEGSVRRSANKLRIEVELIDASSGFSIWSQSYDRQSADVFEIQSEVAENVADKLKVTLLPNVRARVERRPTDNLEAYNLYLEGRFHVYESTEAGFNKAIECLNEAVQKDPNFALGYAWLGIAYGVTSDSSSAPREAVPKARAQEERALALDPDLGQAHVAMANLILFPYDWDWVGADREFKRAVELDPGNFDAHDTYGRFLSLMGRFDEALRETELAHQLDPLSVVTVVNLGDVYAISRRCDRAMDYYQQAIAMAPEFYRAYTGRAGALLCKAAAATLPGWREGKIPADADSLKEWATALPAFQQQAAAAIPDFQKAVSLADFPGTETTLGVGYATAGRRADAMRVLEKLREWSKHRYVTPWAFMSVYRSLGDGEETFRWLDIAYRDRSSAIPAMKEDPSWDVYRSDPRFIAMLKKVGLDK
jgi:adenylate cyclase